jgi:hypothetical protein
MTGPQNETGTLCQPLVHIPLGTEIIDFQVFFSSGNIKRRGFDPYMVLSHSNDIPNSHVVSGSDQASWTTFDCVALQSLYVAVTFFSCSATSPI